MDLHFCNFYIVCSTSHCTRRLPLCLAALVFLASLKLFGSHCIYLGPAVVVVIVVVLAFCLLVKFS